MTLFVIFLSKHFLGFVMLLNSLRCSSHVAPKQKACELGTHKVMLPAHHS